MIDQALWVIYGLRLVDDFEYRYVGLTRVGVEKRLVRHRYDSQKKTKRAVCNWVSKYSDKIVIDVLEECPEGDSTYLFEAEQFWIIQIRSFGHRLKNHSDGGASGSYGARWKLTESQVRRGKNHPMFGTSMSMENRLAQSKLKQGTKMSSESRKKMSESRSGTKHWAYGGGKFSEEHKAKISKSLSGRKLSDEVRQKMSEVRKGVPRSPEAIEKTRLGRLGKKNSVPAWNKGLPNPSAHIGYHTNKNVSKPETCKFCKEEMQ